MSVYIVGLALIPMYDASEYSNLCTNVCILFTLTTV